MATFRISGRILGPRNGQLPAGEVSILLDGAKTEIKPSAEGAFEIFKLEKGKHRIEARVPHYEFGQIEVDISSKFDGAIELRPTRLVVLKPLSEALKYFISKMW